ncbi:MAG: response regulator [Planctomycetota bacterium]|jgi:DNA-binding NarL/FixJ family response regulator
MDEKRKQHKKSGSKTRILIVDDHAVVRQALAQLINHESELVVSAEAENANQALESLEKESVDFVVVDISLNGTNGIQLTKKIKSKYPALPVLILTVHDEAVYVQSAMEAGANGYVNKCEAAEKIITAIRLVLSGKQYISEKMSGYALK